MKIVICDDEELARDRLADLLASIAKVEIIAMVSNGVQLLDFCQSNLVDIVLLDIRMPEMDGLEAAKHLLAFDNPPAIIFITAYDQHAITAFEANASGYLLKPVAKEKLHQSLLHASRLNRAQLANLSNANVGAKARTHICVRRRGNLELIPVVDILYFRAELKYTTIGTATGEVLLEESLKSLELEFTQLFIRIHRSTLVAKSYINSLLKNDKNKWVVNMLHSSRQFEVSRRCLSNLRKTIKVLKVS